MPSQLSELNRDEDGPQSNEGLLRIQMKDVLSYFKSSSVKTNTGESLRFHN